ncbi:rhodanese-related sulfurtransferase, partial [Enterobacter asburiae]
IVDPKATRDALWIALTKLNVFGRIYLAHEGINAQISVPESQVDALREFLYAFDPALDGLRMNIALDDDGKSFWVLRLKVRDRIVADGIDDPTFDASDVGDYLKAAEVNAMLDDP